LRRFGGAGLALRPNLAGFGHVGFEGENAVEGGAALYPSKFKGADDGVFLAVSGERDERVGHADAAQVEGIGAAFGVGVEEGRRRGLR
jgi:hypothetical protein